MNRGRSTSHERGAAIVEFALILPVLVMFLFALITGGIAYDRNLAISYSAQQTARFAATLPVSSYGDVDAWLDAVHERVMATSEGALDQGVADRRICVAFVDPAGAQTRSRTVTDADDAVARSNDPCYDDGLASDEVRSQIVLERGDAIDLVVFGQVPLTLSKDVTTRHEVVG